MSKFKFGDIVRWNYNEQYESIARVDTVINNSMLLVQVGEWHPNYYDGEKGVVPAFSAHCVLEREEYQGHDPNLSIQDLVKKVVSGNIETLKKVTKVLPTKPARPISVALVGPPGAGKTTLSNGLTAELKKEGIRFNNVQEYARNFIDRWGNSGLLELGIFGPYHIATKQLRREKNVPQDVAGYVTDSPLFLPWFYAQAAAQGGLIDHIVLSELYKMFTQSLKEYDIIAFVEPGKPYDQDSTRAQSESEATDLGNNIRQTLERHGAKLLSLKGSYAERLDTLLAEVKGLL